MRRGPWPAIRSSALFSDVTRIDEVRGALAQVLLEAARFRKIGPITYGPGPYNQCNVQLDFEPIWDATQLES